MCEKMNNPDYSKIISVREESGKQLVSARELYQFIDGKERFTRWMERMLEYGFVEHADFEAVNIYVQCHNGIGGTNKKLEALETVKQKELEVKERDKYINSNHHKVNFFDHCVEDDEKLYDMLEASKILMNGRKGGRNTLMNDLREMKILMWNNLPYEQYIHAGYMKVKVVKTVNKYNVEHFPSLLW